jgi:outer membrane protein assembly factor BamA
MRSLWVNIRLSSFWSLFILFLFAEAGFTQVNVASDSLLGKPLGEIEIIGNEVTQEDIILREMVLKPGVVVTAKQLEEDYLRILGLDLFSRVECYLYEKNDSVILRIVVTEEWYIFPIPFFDLSSEDPSEYTYGFRYLQKNFRGRAETLQASLWGGTDRGFRFRHSNPWVRGSPNLTRTIGIHRISRISKNVDLEPLDLETRHSVFQIYFGKRWSLDLTAGLGTVFRLVHADSSIQVASNGEFDRIQEVMLWSVWDDRDFRQFPRKGSFLSLRFSQGWLLNSSDHYQRLLLDFRKYFDLGLFSIGSRHIWIPTWGDSPPYDWIILQQTTPIRSSKLKDEGRAFFMTTVEMRFNLLGRRYFTWHSAPVFKQHFRNLYYGLAGEIFTDFGDTYHSSDQFGLRSLQWGYGFGLLLLIPYVDVVRIEWSWNPEYSFKETRFAWKIGISF